jgi:drug/metabolite transporter (DMT)-like permease
MTQPSAQPPTASASAPEVKRHRVGLAAAAVTIIVWAAAFPAIRLGVREIEPIPLAAIRFAIAGTLALCWLAWRQPPLPTGRDLLRFAACGLIGISIYNMLLNTGQVTVSAGAASFIINLQGVVTALLAMLFLKESFRGLAWLGTAICVSGVGLIASTQPGGIALGAGASLVLAAAFCSGASFVIQRPLVARHGAMNAAAFNILTGGLFLLPWLPAGVEQTSNATWVGTSAVFFLGVFPGAVGYVTWMATLSAFGAARGANALYLVPPVATLLAIPLAGEAPGLVTLAGGVVVLAGVVTVNTFGRHGVVVSRQLSAETKGESGG